jgi:uncharacterized protein (DUF58 family)
MADQSIIDSKFLERLERLAIRWHKSFQGLVGGHNLSGFAGPGHEFLDHRHFHYGDDLRAVNWRAYLRFEKMFLKMFRVEPHVPIRLLVDTSSSMTTGAIPKLPYVKKLAAALCYVGLVKLDTICVEPFAGRLGDGFICSGGRHRFAPAAAYLSGLVAAGKSNFAAVVRQFLARHLQRGLVIVLSDFLDDADCTKPLQYLADYGHELLLVHVWANEDRTPPWNGELELIDAETGARLELQADRSVREAHTAAFDRYSEEIQHLALSSGGRYVGVPTSLPVEDAIFGPVTQARVTA